MTIRRVPLRLPTPVQDVLVALFVTVMGIQGTVTRATAGELVWRPLTDFGNLGYVLLVLGGLAVVGRRRWPVAVFAITALTSLVYYGFGFPDGPGWLALFVALYSLAAYGDGRRSLLIAGTGTAVLAVGWLIAAADIQPAAAIGWVFFRIGAAVMSTALGESIRSRRVIAADAQKRAELAERTREEEARARVDAERVRIAREVHDTVAHAIAIINVQSGVTAHVLDKRPEQVREALHIIERTSSRALREMRAILGVLRGPDNGDNNADDHGRAPHPGLDHLDELTAHAAGAGLDIEVATITPPVPLPGVVDIAAYRILQESITNVIRHVGPTRVTVSLESRADVLEIRVTDQGRRDGSSPPGASEPGRGLVGMRERCELLGGDVEAGPIASGGFEVRARLPLPPVGARL